MLEEVLTWDLSALEGSVIVLFGVFEGAGVPFVVVPALWNVRSELSKMGLHDNLTVAAQKQC